MTAPEAQLAARDEQAQACDVVFCDTLPAFQTLFDEGVRTDPAYSADEFAKCV